MLQIIVTATSSLPICWYRYCCDCYPSFFYRRARMYMPTIACHLIVCHMITCHVMACHVVTCEIKFWLNGFAGFSRRVLLNLSRSGWQLPYLRAGQLTDMVDSKLFKGKWPLFRLTKWLTDQVKKIVIRLTDSFTQGQLNTAKWTTNKNMVLCLPTDQPTFGWLFLQSRQK